MSTTIYCDHCGQPCSGRPEWHQCAIKLPSMQTTFDLCKPCIEEFPGFIGRKPVSASGLSR